MWKVDVVCHHGGIFVPTAAAHKRMMPSPHDRGSQPRMCVDGQRAARRIEQPLRPTPKPRMTREEYLAERKRRRGRKSAHAVFQERLSRALSRGTDVIAVEAAIGYSLVRLRSHLQLQFQAGMSWGNYAAAASPKQRRRVWCIDHIVPKRLFDPGDVRGAFALTNLRPLWWRENMTKAGRRTHLL